MDRLASQAISDSAQEQRPSSKPSDRFSNYRSDESHSTSSTLSQQEYADSSNTFSASAESADNRHGSLLRRFLVQMSGQTGAIAVSCASVLATFAIIPEASSLLWWLLSLVFVVRIGYAMSLGPEPVLGGHLLRKSSRCVIRDEAKISVVILATCQVLNWPISNLALGLFLAMNLVTQMAISHICRVTLRTLNRPPRKIDSYTGNQRVLIVGTGSRAKLMADRILDTPELNTSLSGFLDYRRADLWRYRDVPLVGRPNMLHEIVGSSQVDALLFAVEPEDISRTQSLFAQAETMGVTVCVTLDLYQSRLATAKHMYIDDMSTLVHRATPENRWQLLVKSVIDRIGGAVGLVLSLPIMVVTAIAIKLESKGPVLYRQVRSGVNGKTFSMLKFRTMYRESDNRRELLQKQNEMSGPVFKIKNDPRITQVGLFLRKYSVDELPQFLNVLKGDMSLVGPRPPRPHEVAQYEPWQRRKLSVKPGLTCLWQVRGRNTIDFEDWMKLDLEYIDNWSLKSDAAIMVRTIPAVVKGTGS